MSIEATPRTVVQIRSSAQAQKRVSPPEAGSIPEAPPDEATAALRQLLRIEADIRTCSSIDELSVLLVNEMRTVMGARTAYFLALRSGQPRVMKVSGSTELDPNAPTVRWLEKELRTRPPVAGWEQTSSMTLRVGPDVQAQEGREFPFPEGHWLPLRHLDRHSPFGVLVVGEHAFSDRAITIGERIAGTAAHAAAVLVRKAPRPKSKRAYRVLLYALVVGALAALFYPVPMTALAPMEVVPQDPFVVAAPIDGVIENILAAPNSAVKPGDPIVQYVDTVPRNQLMVAEQEVSVAAARLRQFQQSSFVDESAKREIAQARAELKLKVAERDFARDAFQKSQIQAARHGIAVYADRKEWIGKPVVTGQRILEIADENKVELRAMLPVAEVLNLKPGDRIRAFLNGDPLRPIDAEVSVTGHQARTVEGQGLVYLVTGHFLAGQPLPRPGVRGTAQLFSDAAPLGYYLFRRPLTWVRQKVGL